MRAGRVEVNSQESGVDVVVLLGEHDLGTADELRAAFNSAFDSGRAVAVDMSGTEFIDSSIVAVLVQCGKADDPDAPPVVMSISEQTSASVRRVIELTGLGEHMQIVGGMDEAMAALAGAGS